MAPSLSSHSLSLSLPCLLNDIRTGRGRDLRVLKESLCHVTIIFAPPPPPPFQCGI